MSVKIYLFCHNFYALSQSTGTFAALIHVRFRRAEEFVDRRAQSYPEREKRIFFGRMKPKIIMRNANSQTQPRHHGYSGTEQENRRNLPFWTKGCP